MQRVTLTAAAAVLLAWTAVSASADYKEAPMLASMVAAGELPPVEERLPIEPKVLVPLEAVGTYGGTLKRVREPAQPVAGRGRFAGAQLVSAAHELRRLDRTRPGPGLRAGR